MLYFLLHLINHNNVGIFQDLYSFLTQFFKLYPMYQPNDFYVFGESYAGMVTVWTNWQHVLNPNVFCQANGYPQLLAKLMLKIPMPRW